MHCRHISAKIQPKNLKQHFDWGEGQAPWAPMATPLPCINKKIWWSRFFLILALVSEKIEKMSKMKL